VGELWLVELGGMVAGRVGAIVSAGMVVPCLGVQPAMAAPATAVAESLRKVRREMVDRRFICFLLFE
jgi:hypothetical protein